MKNLDDIILLDIRDNDMEEGEVRESVFSNGSHVRVTKTNGKLAFRILEQK